MILPDRHLLLGMTLGAICATAVAAIGPGWVMSAFADEMAAGIDASKLVKFDGRDYAVDYADWVSTTPLSTARVKKIEAGKVSYVDITTTSTGTYSTDGLTSPNIQYPGIVVTPKDPVRATFSSWSNGNWFRISTYNGNSFISLNNNGVRISTGGGRTCVSTASFRFC